MFIGESGIGKTFSLYLYTYILRLNPFNLVISIFEMNEFLENPVLYLQKEIAYSLYYACMNNSEIDFKELTDCLKMDISYDDLLENLNTLVSKIFEVYDNELNLYVIIDDTEFKSTEKMWDKFTGLKDDIVVFYYTSIDKRQKFWKHFEDKTVEFKKLDNRILTKYIKKEVSLSDKNCEELIKICENDYSRILLEIEKIKNYTGLSPNDALEVLLKDGTIYRPSYDALFDFTAAVLERNPAKAYNLLEHSKNVGEPSLTLISVLYNNIKTLLQIQSAKDYKKLGLNGWVVKNTIQYRDNYSNGELVRAMKLLRKCEIGIKMQKLKEKYIIIVEIKLLQILLKKLL